MVLLFNAILIYLLPDNNDKACPERVCNSNCSQWATLIITGVAHCQQCTVCYVLLSFNLIKQIDPEKYHTAI